MPDHPNKSGKNYGKFINKKTFFQTDKEADNIGKF